MVETNNLYTEFTTWDDIRRMVTENITDRNVYATSGGVGSQSTIGRIGRITSGGSISIATTTTSSSAGTTKAKGYDADGSSKENLHVDTFVSPHDATPNSGRIVDDSTSMTGSLITYDIGAGVASLAAGLSKGVPEEKNAMKGGTYFESSAEEGNDIYDDITAFTGDPDLGGTRGAWLELEEALGKELAEDDDTTQQEEEAKVYSKMPVECSKTSQSNSSQVLAVSNQSSGADHLHATEPEETEVPRPATLDNTLELEHYLWRLSTR